MHESGFAEAEPADCAAVPVTGSLLKRYLLALAGILCVALGWIGTFVPGLPTVGFLLIASYCFTRSCPWLEQRLIRNRWFARFLHYLDGDLEMPLKARLTALAMMWTSIAVSLSVLLLSGRRNPWLLGAIVLAGLFGTIAIWRFRRGKNSAAKTGFPEPACPGISPPDPSHFSSGQAPSTPDIASVRPTACPAGFTRRPAAPNRLSVSAARKSQ